MLGPAGTYVVRACESAFRWGHPLPVGIAETFRLAIEQRGADVTGTIEIATFRFPVRGRVSGDQISLSGHYEHPGPPNALQLVLFGGNARRDRVGNLSGRFSYTYSDGSTDTSDGELWHVFQRP